MTRISNDKNTNFRNSGFITRCTDLENIYLKTARWKPPINKLFPFKITHPAQKINLIRFQPSHNISREKVRLCLVKTTPRAIWHWRILCCQHHLRGWVAVCTPSDAASLPFWGEKGRGFYLPSARAVGSWWARSERQKLERGEARN